MSDLSPFQRLLKRLTLRQVDDATFIGGSGSGGVTENARLFGGLVAAQASMAALETVPDPFLLHSLHGYFLLPGRAQSDIRFDVTATKQGRNFHARSVFAYQNDQVIFQLQASFMRPEQGVEHSPTMPDVPPPDALPNRDQLRGRKNWQAMPVDVRMIDPITNTEAQPPEQRIWLRANAQPGSAKLNIGMLVYASDRTLLDTAWRPHADQGKLAGASLDHSIWLHQVPRMDEWLLYDMHRRLIIHV